MSEDDLNVDYAAFDLSRAHIQRSPFVWKSPRGRAHVIWEIDSVAVSIPDGWSILGYIDEYGERRLKPDAEITDELLLGEHFVSSLTIKRAPKSEVPAERAVAVLCSFAPQLLPDTDDHDSERGDTSTLDWMSPLRLEPSIGNQEEPSGEFLPAQYSTVVHAVIAVDAIPSSDAMEHALDHARYLAQITYRAIYAVTREARPLPEFSTNRQNLIVGHQIIVDGAFRTVLHAARPAIHTDLVGSTRELDHDDCEELGVAVLAEAFHEPMTRVLDTRREAKVALDAGDVRSAVIMSAVSCEILIQTLLSCLLWEDGKTPDEAHGELSQPDLRQRLINVVKTRLRGSWTPKDNQPFSDWLFLIQKPRNIVIHTGQPPGLGDAALAHDAVYSFTSMIFDRLANPAVRKNYPLTALFIVNEAGLQNRNAWTKAMQRAAADVEENDLLGVFKRWSGATSTLSLPEEFRARPQDGIVKFVHLMSGHTYWVEHDEYSDQARIVVPERDPSALISRFEVMRSSRTPTPRTFSCDPAPRVRPKGDWVPDHRLVPGVHVMRDPIHWDVPSDAPVS